MAHHNCPICHQRVNYTSHHQVDEGRHSAVVAPLLAKVCANYNGNYWPHLSCLGITKCGQCGSSDLPEWGLPICLSCFRGGFHAHFPSGSSNSSSSTHSPTYSSSGSGDGGRIFVGYLLLFFLGWLGAHKFFVSKPGVAWFYIVLTVAGVFTAGITWLILLIALFIDLFKLPKQVRYS